jgi:hypothetical protein
VLLTIINLMSCGSSCNTSNSSSVRRDSIDQQLNTMKSLLVMIFCLAVLVLNGQTQDTLKPSIRLDYINEMFDSNTIKKEKFRSRQLLPIAIFLEKQGQDLKDESYTIDTVEVIFIFNKVQHHRHMVYKGHLVFLSVYWPEEYSWELGSKIIFRARYKHWLKSQVVNSGTVEKIIEF